MRKGRRTFLTLADLFVFMFAGFLVLSLNIPKGETHRVKSKYIGFNISIHNKIEII